MQTNDSANGKLFEHKLLAVHLVVKNIQNIVFARR